MPESRDRISRAEDVASVFVRRQRSIRGLGVYIDETEDGFGSTPFRWGNAPLTGGQRAAATGRGSGGVGSRGILGTPRNAVRRGGRDNTGSHRRARGGGSIIPSWYPRRPLQDITAIARAIERRRGSLRESEGLQLESSAPQRGQNIREPYSATPSSIAQLEQLDSSMKTPNPTRLKRLDGLCPPSVAKILLNITSQNEGELDSLTPQKKLLNSIDIVGKVVMDELDKMKKTPSAKRAERSRKMRTLMSMR